MKAFQVTLSDNTELTVRELAPQDLTLFLRCLPALKAIGKITEASDQIEQGMLMPPPDVPPAIMDAFHELLAHVAGLSREAYERLTLWDSLAIMNAFMRLMPNFTAAGEPAGLAPIPSLFSTISAEAATISPTGP
jgi:hypothetical protein